MPRREGGIERHLMNYIEDHAICWSIIKYLLCILTYLHTYLFTTAFIQKGDIMCYYKKLKIFVIHIVVYTKYPYVTFDDLWGHTLCYKKIESS